LIVHWIGKLELLGGLAFPVQEEAERNAFR